MSPSSPAGSSSSSLPFSNVLLALPDGSIPSSHADLTSPTTSRIGGYPTLPVPQPVPAFNCGVCHKPTPLLAQVYCPPDEGENDRTVYVFACGRRRCQRREGCVRAWRGSRRNEVYVKDVEEKRRAREEEERKERERQRINPFTMGADSAHGGSALFGAAPTFGSSANPFAPAPSGDAPDISNLSISQSESAAIPPQVSSTLSAPHPAYHPAQYITTVEEYLPPPEEMDIDDDEDDEEDESIKAEWKDERFESLFPKGVDAVFERFVRRINTAEGGEQQVLRYELGGVPMPYSSKSPLTKKLFPSLPQQKPDDDEPTYEEHYDASKIPACPRCRGPRVFEMQLLPSLISILRPESLSTTGSASQPKPQVPQSEEERKKELVRLAKGDDDTGAEDNDGGEAIDGMEWGNVLLFGCKNDCVGFGEEWIGVEWETTLSPA